MFHVGSRRVLKVQSTNFHSMYQNWKLALNSDNKGLQSTNRYLINQKAPIARICNPCVHNSTLLHGLQIRTI